MALQLREYRVRTKYPEAAIKERKGKILTDKDRCLLVEGPCRFLDTEGKPFLTYCPEGVTREIDAVYDILTTIRASTENRGYASATAERVTQGNQKRGIPVASSILGAYEASGFYSQNCRLTTWTKKELDSRWPELFPLFKACARVFEEYQPDRYAAQMAFVKRTQPDWIIPDTPFTTCTLNNSYSTGMHQDDGDLDEGFSVLAVARRGNYTGGYLTMPEAGIGVDMKNGDVVLMNAHRGWHGNTRMYCECGNVLGIGSPEAKGHAGTRPCPRCGAERISVVLYFRTEMTECGSKAEEDIKAIAWGEKLSAGQSSNRPQPSTVGND